jgi:hypothetical protein
VPDRSRPWFGHAEADLQSFSTRLPAELSDCESSNDLFFRAR